MFDLEVFKGKSCSRLLLRRYADEPGISICRSSVRRVIAGTIVVCVCSGIAAAQLPTLRAVASADLHNLVFQRDYRIIPATLNGWTP